MPAPTRPSTALGGSMSAAHYTIGRIALIHSIFHHSAVQPSRG